MRVRLYRDVSAAVFAGFALFGRLLFFDEFFHAFAVAIQFEQLRVFYLVFVGACFFNGFGESEQDLIFIVGYQCLEGFFEFGLLAATECVDEYFVFFGGVELGEVVEGVVGF